MRNQSTVADRAVPVAFETDRTAPKVEALISAGVHVVPHSAAASPYVWVVSVLGQVVAFAKLVPRFVWLFVFARRTTLSTSALVAAALRRISSVIPVIVASAGIAILSCALIFLPMIATGRLRGRGLLVGGLLYAVYLALVLSSIGG